ncbi:MAG: MATE family efflux transporter, partial [Eubacteriales bacterium]|nr:MATE family efflux transporter [Eubacteriales bacterium]
MKAQRTTQEKFIWMTTAPIPKLIISLSIPTIVSMVVSSLYNMADTFFVGQIGTSATGGVGILFSLMAVIQAVGFTFGQGSGNYISRKLGQQDHRSAEQMAATAFFSAIGLGVVVAVAGLLFLDPLMRMLGATETILPHARSYARYILIGAPCMIGSLVLNNQLRFQGSAFYSMIGIAVGAVINVGLDPLFIFVFHMGTGGAALATIISQFISFLLLLRGTTQGSNIRISLRNFKPSWALYYETMRGGL